MLRAIVTTCARSGGNSRPGALHFRSRGILYTVAIAICLIGADKCDRLNSESWTPLHDLAQGNAACMKQGQEYAAEHELVKVGSYMKVFCRPADNPPENAA